MELVAWIKLLVYFMGWDSINKLNNPYTYVSKTITIIDTKLDIELNASKIYIDYQSQSDQAIFDLCDMNGRIRLSGTIVPNQKKSVDISRLKNGQYQVYVIDNGEIAKKLISL